MKTYRININIDREIKAEDIEAAESKFFKDIENNNETIENLVADNLRITQI